MAKGKGNDPFANLPPAGGKKAKKETPKQRAADAAKYQKAKAQNPYFRGQAYLEKKQELGTIYEAYTGWQITDKQARYVIAHGWSNYHFQVKLSSEKSFVGSPVWKSNYPRNEAVYKQMFGQNSKPKQKVMAYAIVHNLDGEGFAQYLRDQPGYTKSVEFKNTTATLDNIYRSIMGSPDDQANYKIKQAALAGWSQDQFAKFLRGSKQYAYSNEARDTFDKLAQAFGGTTTMNYSQMAKPPGPDQGGPPDDTRVPPPYGEQAGQGVGNG